MQTVAISTQGFSLQSTQMYNPHRTNIIYNLHGSWPNLLCLVQKIRKCSLYFAFQSGIKRQKRL